MEHDFAVDEDKAEHIWNGAYGNAQGSILGKWVSRAERDGRVHDGVEYDPKGAEIVISSDIGFRDTTSWWYWQATVGGFRLLAYEGDSGLDADDWIPRVQDQAKELGAKRIGRIWLPQDAKAKTFQSKHSSIERFLKAFGHDKVKDVPPTKKADQISAARAVIGRCEFHKTRCEEGLDGLAAWQFKYIEEADAFSREPDHNWASHPSDAFSYGCQVMQLATPVKPIEETKFAIKGNDAGMKTVTVAELWKQTKTARSSRI
jgi:phage terminase large subunit